jgi:DNA-binding NtrC family response regulator
VNPEPSGTTQPPSTEKRCVLIVDDEDSVRTVATRMLQLSGFEVLVGRDGQEGLDLFTANRGRVCILLLDMTMPRLGGEEVLERVRELSPSMRVILMSGYSRRDAGPLLGDGRITGFLQKPFTFAQLKEQMRTLLETVA